MLEKSMVISIQRYLKTLGPSCFFWKEAGGPYGTSGIPDLILCYKGRFVGLEVKTPVGRLSELQMRTMEKISAADGIALRVESVEDVRRVLRDVDEILRRNNYGDTEDRP